MKISFGVTWYDGVVQSGTMYILLQGAVNGGIDISSESFTQPLDVKTAVLHV